MQTYYPGNSRVDIVGLNALLLQKDSCDTQTFIQQFNRNIAIITQFAEKNKKVPAITYTGLESVKVSDFFSQDLYPVISQYKLSFVMFGANAWNQEEHYFIPVPGAPRQATISSASLPTPTFSPATTLKSNIDYQTHIIILENRMKPSKISRRDFIQKSGMLLAASAIPSFLHAEEKQPTLSMKNAKSTSTANGTSLWWEVVQPAARRAISAAREGAKTLLIEAMGQLGGMGTTA